MARLTLASLIGGVIGLNRQITGKAAGLRTHMLVSLGSALFVTILLELETVSTTDAISRAIQGVATGIGFLGAGEIVHQSMSSGKPKIKGLTTAAAIWVTAALGMAVGCGLWQVGLMGMMLALLILSGAKQIERRIPPRHDDDDEPI
jgi:putative Mg2+ transporter-C (MgtC) family protein